MTQIKMGKKVFLCIFVIFGISLSLFANGEKEQEAADGPLVIDWLGYNSYNPVDPDSIIVKAMEEKYNVRFNIWFVDDKEWERSVAVRLAAGDMPDYMKVKPGGKLRRFVEQGILTPITDEMLGMIPAYTEIMNEVDPQEEWKVFVTVDDQLYGLRQYNINGSYPTVLVWRKDWLENVGISQVPQTIEEFEEAMYKFTFEDPDGNGVDDTYGLSATVFHTVLGAFGHPGTIDFAVGDGNAVLFREGGKFAYASIRPEMKEALALLNKWYEDGIIDPEFITGENKGGYWAVSHSFVNGKIGVTGKAMAYHWQPGYAHGAYGRVLREMVKVNPGLEYGKQIIIGKSPVGPDGKSGASTWGALAGHPFSFTVKAAEDPRTIPTILRMLNDNLSDIEQYRFNAYGMEGEHYSIDADGTVLPDKEFAESQAAKDIGFKTFGGGMQNPEFDKQFKPVFYQFMDETRNTGYPVYTVAQTDELSRFGGDLGKLTLQTYIKIILGEIPVSDFDTYVETFRRQGGDDVVASLDAFFGF